WTLHLWNQPCPGGGATDCGQAHDAGSDDVHSCGDHVRVDWVLWLYTGGVAQVPRQEWGPGQERDPIQAGGGAGM
ncbi:hypothetical protein BGZ52_003933, partial [Haplosporangium bisporale]